MHSNKSDIKSGLSISEVSELSEALMQAAFYANSFRGIQKAYHKIYYGDIDDSPIELKFSHIMEANDAKIEHEDIYLNLYRALNDSFIDRKSVSIAKTTKDAKKILLNYPGDYKDKVHFNEYFRNILDKILDIDNNYIDVDSDSGLDSESDELTTPQSDSSASFDKSVAYLKLPSKKRHFSSKTVSFFDEKLSDNSENTENKKLKTELDESEVYRLYS